MLHISKLCLFVLCGHYLFKSACSNGPPELRVVCVTSESLLPERGKLCKFFIRREFLLTLFLLSILERESPFVNNLCTDLLYRTSLLNETSIATLTSFQERHSDLHLRISILDSALETLSPLDFFKLVYNLKLVRSAGLDVTFSSQTEVSLLQRTLQSYERILRANSLGLTITISSFSDVNSISNQGILDLVDSVFYIPSPIVEKYHGDFNIAEVANVVPATKLLVGLPSTIFVVPAFKDQLKTPSLVDLCRGQNLLHWQPKVSIDDQVHWMHRNHNWTFRMQMGEALNDQLSYLFGISSGIVLFDVPIHEEENPTCFKHKSLFFQSIQQAALQFGFNLERRMKRGVEQSQIRLSTVETSRLGKVLIFAIGSEEEQFKRYYSILDDESLLDGPVHHITLGYDDSGKIYDVYQQMPQDLSHESIFNTIHQYYVDKILGGEGVFGFAQFKPPTIIIYPNASGTHPVPLLVTWVRIASPIEILITRKTRKPTLPSTSMVASTTSMATTTLTSTTSKPIATSTTTKISTTTAHTTQPSTTASTSTTTSRPCSGPVPPNRCFIPNSLMNVLNMSIVQSTSTMAATTRKPTTARQATTKPAIPMNPNARYIDPEEVSQSYSAMSSSDQTQLVATETRSPQVACNWEPNPPFVVCKTPVHVQRRSITEVQHKTFESISAISKGSVIQHSFNYDTIM